MGRNSPTTGGATEALLTVKDIAALDQCSEKTVRRAIDAGLLDAVRIGVGARLLRVSHSAHERYRRVHLG